MATKPKPKPKPEPDPEPDEEEGLSLLERVENLENRMTKLEAELKEPPIRLGKRA